MGRVAEAGMKADKICTVCGQKPITRLNRCVDCARFVEKFRANFDRMMEAIKAG